MSTLANWTYTDTLTIWPFVEENELNVPVYGSPYTVQGSWEEGGGVQVTDSGEEFVALSTYYFEAADGSDLIPTRADYIFRGDLTAEDDPIEAGAEKIKKVGGWSMAPFGPDELPDWRIMT